MYILLISVALLVLAVCGIVAYYGKRFKDLLKAYPTYSAKLRETDPPVSFRYVMEDADIKQLREQYHLDAVAGNGSETEKLIHLMKWVHRLASHTPNASLPEGLNALHLIELCRSEKKKLNCWLYSIVLNEVYLSLGYASRLIHLKPHSGENKESHFVTAVYSPEAGGWIMMDADMGGYLRDETGRILGIAEIRRRLMAGETLVVNDDIGGFVKVAGKWSYPWYLSKNIFYYDCQQTSEFGQESLARNGGRTYFALVPDGFREAALVKPETTRRGNRIVSINDEALFWQAPVEKRRV